MKAYLVKTIFGVALMDENLNLVDFKAFKEDELLKKNVEIQEGKILPEEIELIEKYKDTYEKIIVEKPFTYEKYKDKIEVQSTLRGVKAVIPEILINLGIIKNREEYQRKLLEISELLTKEKIRKRYSEPDMIIIHSIDAIEDLDKIINLSMERLREFYNLYFPELDNIVDDHKTYAVLVYELTERNNFTKKNLEELIKKYDLELSDKTIEAIIKSAKVSMGGDVSKELLDIYKHYAKTVLELMKIRERLTRIIDEYTKEYTPNLRAIAGPTIVAKLLSLAGSLERLAKFPASTIQVIGAERALFRHLRTGAKPPKHGVIFQMPEIRYSPRKLRGKIARVIATKLCIAAKADAFTKRYIGDKLKEDLRKRLEEIKRK